jgi:hypothetical protein
LRQHSAYRVNAVVHIVRAFPGGESGCDQDEQDGDDNDDGEQFHQRKSAFVQGYGGPASANALT